MGISNISINQKIEKHPTFQNLAKELDVRGKAANLKVSIFRKQIFLYSFEPKNERDYFLISENGSNQNNEGTFLY
jgi:hypothetical protein